jgi:hypothetical protein
VVNAAGISLTAGQEYTAFRIGINHARTIGAGSCAGCAESVAVQFRSLRLTQPATDAGGCGSPAAASLRTLARSGDFLIRANPALDDWIAYWQAVPRGFTTRLGVPPRVSPAVRLTCTNPARGTARVELVTPRAMRCTLALFDLTGRRRRTLLDEAIGQGARTLAWDGRDDAGKPLASGYYVLRLVTESGTLNRPLIYVN